MVHEITTNQFQNKSFWYNNMIFPFFVVYLKNNIETKTIQPLSTMYLLLFLYYEQNKFEYYLVLHNF